MINKYYALNKTIKYNKNLTIILFIVQLLGLSLIAISMEELNKEVLAFCGLFIVFSMVLNIFLPKLTKGDNTIIYVVNMLYTIGLLMILRMNLPEGRNHILWYMLSIIVFTIVFLFLNKFIRFFENKFFLYFFITLATFILTLVLADGSQGARNWIRIGNYTIQLSEFAKISFTFMIASFYGNYKKYTSMKYGKFYLNIATYIFIAMFFLQGELGTAMIFFAMFICSSFVFEKNYGMLILNILLAVLGLVAAYYMFNHIRVRFSVWLDPWADYHRGGYQIIQGLFAIASGGLFGTGLGNGHPNLIPVSTSDYIVPSVMEEMGVFMGISIILLYVLLIYKGLKIALVNENNFYSALAFSISIIFAAQSLIMFGGVLKLIPLTGITTPFMSYGGSSTLTNFILVAVLQIVAGKRGDR